MRRVVILFVVVGLLVALPGAATAKGKPTAPEIGRCEFEEGVLQGWDDGSRGFVCQWYVPERGTYRLHLEGSVLRPYLAVKDAWLPQGNFCHKEVHNGWHTALVSDSFSLPADGECLEDYPPEYGEDDWGVDYFALHVVGKGNFVVSIEKVGD